jgi:DNA-directed RNA polymerase specialized sigma24 family protein
MSIKNNIILRAFDSALFKDAFNSIEDRYLADDVRQEVYLILFNKSNRFINKLQSKGRIIRYATMTFLNNCFWERGCSVYRYKSKELSVSSFSSFSDQLVCEEYIELNPEEFLSKIHWYQAVLIRLYAEEGTYMKVAKLTGIPVGGVFEAIKRGRNQIKCTI